MNRIGGFLLYGPLRSIDWTEVTHTVAQKPHECLLCWFPAVRVTRKVTRSDQLLVFGCQHFDLSHRAIQLIHQRQAAVDCKRTDQGPVVPKRGQPDLISCFAETPTLTYSTSNARSEGLSQKATDKGPWHYGKFGIILPLHRRALLGDRKSRLVALQAGRRQTMGLRRSVEHLDRRGQRRHPRGSHRAAQRRRCAAAAVGHAQARLGARTDAQRQAQRYHRLMRGRLPRALRNYREGSATAAPQVGRTLRIRGQALTGKVGATGWATGIA